MKGSKLKMNKTQDILDTYFSVEVKDLSPVDYNLYIQSEDTSEDSNFPSLPQGTLILASSDNSEGLDLLIVKTPDNIYHLVDESHQYLIELSETPDVDLKSNDLYEIRHYDENSTYYHFTSYTSYTGLIIHQLVNNVDPHLGGFYTLTTDFTNRSKYSKYVSVSI